MAAAQTRSLETQRRVAPTQTRSLEEEQKAAPTLQESSVTQNMSEQAPQESFTYDSTVTENTGNTTTSTSDSNTNIQVQQDNFSSSDNYRPSIESLVSNYYSQLNNGNYEDSWNTLSYELRNNKQDHPDGYNSYLKWWNLVSYVDAKIIESEHNDSDGIVKVRSKLKLHSGRVINSGVKYNLLWNSADQKWEIDKITLIS